MTMHETFSCFFTIENFSTFSLAPPAENCSTYYHRQTHAEFHPPFTYKKNLQREHMRERRSLRPTYYNSARDYGWRRLLSIVSTKPFCLPYEAWPGLSGASRGRELDNGGVFNNHSRSSRLADQRVTYRTRYCVRACVTWNVGL